MYDISLQICHQKYLFPLVFRTISAARILFSIACSQIKAGGYNPKNGHFTAKESRVYMSHFHALSHSGDQITVDLYHGQYYIDSLYGGSDGEYATGSNAATLNLAAGDTVFLKS